MAIPIYHSVSVIALIVLVQVNVCHLSRQVNLSNIEWRNETILCTGQSNSIRPDVTKTDFRTGIAEVMRFRFSVKTLPENNLRPLNLDNLTVQIKVADQDGRKPEAVIGNKLKVGSTFTFKGGTWEILRMGIEGINVQGNEVCRSGFIHIRQIYP